MTSWLDFFSSSYFILLDFILLKQKTISIQTMRLLNNYDVKRVETKPNLASFPVYFGCLRKNMWYVSSKLSLVYYIHKVWKTQKLVGNKSLLFSFYLFPSLFFCRETVFFSFWLKKTKNQGSREFFWISKKSAISTVVNYFFTGPINRRHFFPFFVSFLFLPVSLLPFCASFLLLDFQHPTIHLTNQSMTLFLAKKQCNINWVIIILSWS